MCMHFKVYALDTKSRNFLDELLHQSNMMGISLWHICSVKEAELAVIEALSLYLLHDFLLDTSP